MGNFRKCFPIPRATPINTFPRRLMRKWYFLISELVDYVGISLGFFGARTIGISSNGNSLLKLNKDYALGCRGTVLELPRDQVIYRMVKRTGSWELEESKFLAHGLERVRSSVSTAKVALIDIGANAGLVTLQAINLSIAKVEVFLFEPVPRHAAAIRHNLRDIPEIHINEFALSDRNGEAIIFTQATNHGNSSLLNSVVPEAGMISTEIQLVDTTMYCNKYLDKFDSYIIKCDTQGMDAVILSRVPERIWENCESAVIEIWALNEISPGDVEVLLAMFERFEYVSWFPIAGNAKVELSEVRDFWLSKSGAFRNLFLSKTLYQG